VQQAVEKGLKALFIEQQGKLAPRTHNLEALGRLLRVPATVLDDLNEINPSFGLTRYPDMSEGLAPVDSISRDDAADLLAAADRVMTWLNEQLNPPSNQP
jgi:HEPN domain-containing protein